jgi:2-keto-4-pentenoate hydratase
MVKTLIEKTADKLVNAFLKNKIIAPLPLRYTKKLSEAQKLRKLCESKVKDPIIGFKAAGTGMPVIKKFKEKEPFYASIYKKNVLKNGKNVKINKYTLGIELEVCYQIKKTFFSSSVPITMKNIYKFISHMAPCIEIVGYRQRKKGITSFGDLCSDFGANVKFLMGKKKIFKKININNLKTNITNKKNNQSVNGNTNTVFINPLNSLRFVLNKVKKDGINLNKNFYVFTGSTVGVVPIKSKGLYTGKIDKLGSVKAIIS